MLMLEKAKKLNITVIDEAEFLAWEERALDGAETKEETLPSDGVSAGPETNSGKAASGGAEQLELF
jgi:hypothetical protein